MSLWDYKYRPLSLFELLEELENPEYIRPPPDGIVLFPPVNGNSENTDEDSGEENSVAVDNLPATQLQAPAEVLYDAESDWESEDDQPLSTFISKTSKINKIDMSTVKWTSEDLNDNNWPQWKEITTQESTAHPIDLFRQFFDYDVIKMLVQFSNTYALQHNCSGDITEDEMMCFIGILLVSGYCRVNRRRMYWENSDDTNNKLISESMSRERFQYIMSNLHCCDNQNLKRNDKFSKMRPLFDMLNIRFRKFAPMFEFHSVDEAMVPYFGRHTCKQYIKGKPIRWGYKFWIGATKYGYIVWFDPYQGCSSFVNEKYKDLGLGASVVLTYVDILQEIEIQPYHIFCDNFFTSFTLLDELKKRQVKCTGTVRENRIGKCPIESKQLKKMDRASIGYKLGNDSIIVCKWNDNNIVCTSSNALPVFPTNKVKRYSRKEKKLVHIDQPNLIKFYNENMGGVDRADENIALNRVSIRGKKWYFPLFAQIIDMAVQNAWQLHRIGGGTNDQLAFRRRVATAILESHKKTTKRGPSRQTANLHDYSRYDRIDHLIIYQEKQTRCKVCHKNSFFKCNKCNCALHPKQCFYDYHTNLKN